MLFSILIFDKPNSASLRDVHRQAHLDYLKTFDDQTLFAGPFTEDDESEDLGSFRLIDLPNRAAAEKHISDEPYIIEGIQDRWEIYRMSEGLLHSWRDCPRTAGNIQALFYAIDDRNAADKRAQYQGAHEAYFKEQGDSIMMHGQLLDDAGHQPIGSVSLLDLPDLDAGYKIMQDEPYCRSGLYAKKLLHRWRFGRVFDRFKM
ncbi:MAG: hypothetical protein JXQ99_04560 [Hyphomicrobiaceae bacterium]